MNDTHDDVELHKFAVTHFENTLAIELLKAAGIEPRRVRKLVLTLALGEPGILELETFADGRILDVRPDGVTVEKWPDNSITEAVKSMTLTVEQGHAALNRAFSACVKAIRGRAA